MKKFKKFLCLCLALSMVLALGACANEKADDTEESDNTAKNDDPEALPPENTGRVIFMLYHDIAPGDTLRETDTPAWCTTEAKLREDLQDINNDGGMPLLFR